MRKEAKVVGGIGEKKSNNNTQYYQQDRIYDNEISIAVTTAFNPYYQVGGGKNLMDQSKTETELRIRKLTPKECFRLMGLKDEDIEKVMEHQTNASGYHLAGDSIVTTCIMRIASQFIGIDYKDKFKPEEWWKDA